MTTPVSMQLGCTEYVHDRQQQNNEDRKESSHQKFANEAGLGEKSMRLVRIHILRRRTARKRRGRLRQAKSSSSGYQSSKQTCMHAQVKRYVTKKYMYRARQKQEIQIKAQTSIFKVYIHCTSVRKSKKIKVYTTYNYKLHLQAEWCWHITFLYTFHFRNLNTTIMHMLSLQNEIDISAQRAQGAL